MARTPSPLHTKRIPKRASKPVEPAEAAVAPPAAKNAKPAASAKVAKPVEAAPAKAHKPKLVRDSFTMPKDEYQVIDALKARALGLEKHVRKSELLRAGIRALAALNDRALLKAIAAVPTLKTGRPKGD